MPPANRERRREAPSGLLSDAQGRRKMAAAARRRGGGSAALARAAAQLSGRGRPTWIRGPPGGHHLKGPPGSASSSLSGDTPPGLSRAASPSLLQSLDELFSGEADPPSDISTGSDFRVNILSLDDLAPAVASRAEEFKEAMTVEGTGKPRNEPRAVLIHAATQSAFKVQRAFSEDTVSLEDEADEDLGETDISEQLSDASVGVSLDGPARASSPEYSEDFESYPLSAEANDAEGPASSSEELWGRQEASLPSTPSDFSSPGSLEPQRRRSVRDKAVQTSTSSFPYQDLHAHLYAADIPWMGQTPGGRGAGTSPGVSRCLSPDILEAGTTTSPAASALNELLRQNVLLICHFVEASRHLHASMVASLEEENFHYHTLEEAKTYISCHKPPPLTMEQALRELEEEERGGI
ncbi:uncharacterized protein C19orf44 homolog isoform X1 [Pogona vitticeps]